MTDISSFKKLTSLQITEDTTLSGSFLVDGFITVLPQATLTVLPGTVLLFSADSGILVFGRIVLAGSADSPVKLSSSFLSPSASDWSGVMLAGTEKKNIFEYVILQGAETAINVSFSSFSAKNLVIEKVETALKLVDSTVSMRDSNFSSAVNGIYAFKSEIELERVAFERCSDGLTIKSSSLSANDLTFAANSSTGLMAENSRLKLERGLFLSNKIGAKISGTEGSVANCRFRNNSEAGIMLSSSAVRFVANVVTGGGVGVMLEDNLSALWGNSLSGNNYYNLLYLGSQKFSAGGNWFGSNSDTEVHKGVYSKQPGTLSLKPLLTADPLTNQEVQKLRKRR